MIKRLPKEKYQDFELDFHYQSYWFYDVIRELDDDIMVLKFLKTKVDKAISRKFVDKLYASHYENAEAYGYFVDDGLAGVLEINFESWNQRVRITECIVFDRFLRKGIGSKLMAFGEERAKALNARAMVLETQTSNVRAIDFYRNCGFSLIGTDLHAYSNADCEKREVRIEMGKIV